MAVKVRWLRSTLEQLMSWKFNNPFLAPHRRTEALCNWGGGGKNPAAQLGFENRWSITVYTLHQPLEKRHTSRNTLLATSHCSRIPGGSLRSTVCACVLKTFTNACALRNFTCACAWMPTEQTRRCVSCMKLHFLNFAVAVQQRTGEHVVILAEQLLMH